ncbi:MAG: hypothetical protein K2K77_09475, partial [Duncaniella sp.]|nr:hypothetical protein [Duncaniella sp.]
VVAPKVSFKRPAYSLAKGELVINVTADVAPASDIVVPVSVAAAVAKEGTDYTMPVKNVTIKAGETSGSLTIARVDDNVGEDNLELTVNLGQGEGYNLGLRNFVTVTLLSKNGYILSFDEANARINGDQTFTLNVTNMSGYGSLPAADTFTLEVDPEGTTAVEGTHFTVTKSVAIAEKGRNGSFEVKLLKVEEGKDQVVLRISEKAGYAFGSNPILTIKLAGPDNFNGTWAFKSWENRSLAELYGEDMSTAPEFSSADQLTFSGSSINEYTFTPSLKGGLKNYFGTESRTVKLSGTEVYLYQEGMRSKWVNLSVLKVPGVNGKFSATQTETREAKVGFRLIYVGDEEILECVIDDFKPVDTELWCITGYYMSGMDLDENHPADDTHPAAWFPYQ